MSKKFASVSLPKELIDKIDSIIRDGRYGYESRPEFIKEAIRKRLSELGYEINRIVHALKVWNVTKDSVTIFDETLNRWVNVLIREGKIICELDRSEDCTHVRFAAEIPEIVSLFRRMGWKLRRR
ncbi:MAG: ribbon-helix-helix domain-containing protein [Candidatus Methylarchaceae archaeon HK01B]|nr:ribbon-helix-helix domain-containing protein [Candidatus Methylarchaceae archaeon HK01M]MCP8312101.1 ribbon-helix-helix domain-containing protein [Candidatus Methylarchaceae archaeon HK02M1]MCP8318998.1 ribbon-helix-helix domain-containing protein [Candidatus Methylarchaceae archaeon HK01B]